MLSLFLALLGVAASKSLSSAGSEEAATKAAESLDVRAVEADDVEALVHKGWHSTVQALVSKSHQGSEEDAQYMATQVRQAVMVERNRLDDLIRALDRNYGRAVDVNPAMQWAQNSTHVFLAVKFAQRWNAPGALETANESFSTEPCCVNFTAFGEHSMIKRRYLLSLELFQPLAGDGSSWAKAAAGRISVTLKKAQPANWPRMTKGQPPQNLGIWRDMRDKWVADLEKLPQMGEKKKAEKAEPRKSSKRKSKRKDDEDEDALDKEVDLLGECEGSSFKGSSVAELCSDAWQGVVSEQVVKHRRWLVEFYTSDGTGNLEAMKTLMPLWKRLADVFPSLVPHGRIGAVDCNREKDLCKKLGVKKFPQVRRYVGDDVKEWKAAFTASIEEFAAFGDKSEL